MKRFFKALGISSAYFITFLIIQLWVSFSFVLLSLGDLFLQHGSEIFRDPGLMGELYVSGMTEGMTGIILASNILTVLGFWGFFLARGKSFPWEIGLQKTSGKNIWLSLLFGFGLCFTVDLLTSLIPISEAMLEEFEMQHDVLWEGSAGINFLSVALIGPISEEICFRGLCYTRLRKGMGKLWSGLISATFFGIAHGDPVWFLVGFAFGIGLAWIFETTGSLWTCILVHITNNTISYVSSYLPMSLGLHWTLIALAVLALIVSVHLLRRENHRAIPAVQEI